VQVRAVGVTRDSAPTLFVCVERETVVIGRGDAVRAAELVRAIETRSAVVVSICPPDQAVAAGRDAGAAVVVLDGYPAAATLRAIADVTTARQELSVLVLGRLDPNIDVLVALASGVFGYLPDCSSAGAVAEAVAALLAGDAVLPRAVSFPLVQHLRSGGRGVVVSCADGRAVTLTNREWDVLVRLRQARSTADIARQLVVANGTVRSHVAALVHKLGAVDRSALVVSNHGDGH
jgi:DNA-binding NarL/FixJ family response regulator